MKFVRSQSGSEACRFLSYLFTWVSGAAYMGEFYLSSLGAGIAVAVFYVASVAMDPA